ncbi:hypothetical protein [Nostoc sp.]
MKLGHLSQEVNIEALGIGHWLVVILYRKLKDLRPLHLYVDVAPI